MFEGHLLNLHMHVGQWDDVNLYDSPAAGSTFDSLPAEEEPEDEERQVQPRKVRGKKARGTSGKTADSSDATVGGEQQSTGDDGESWQPQKDISESFSKVCHVY